MYVEPAVPVKVDVLLDGVVTFPPAPLMILHAPVPTDGEFPANVTEVNPQVAELVWSAPAAAAVGFRLNVITTSSVEAVHGLLLIVQRKVYVEPAVPVNVDVALDAVVTLPPVPETILHAPVPTVGVFPAKVTLVKPHVAAPVWSGPAFAAVGFRLNVIFTLFPLAVQGLLLIVHRKV